MGRGAVEDVCVNMAAPGMAVGGALERCCCLEEGDKLAVFNIPGVGHGVVEALVFALTCSCCCCCCCRKGAGVAAVPLILVEEGRAETRGSTDSMDGTVKLTSISEGDGAPEEPFMTPFVRFVTPG